MEEERIDAAQLTNGAAPSDAPAYVPGVRPSTSDMMVDKQHNPASLAKEMMTGSDDPSEYLARTETDRQGIAIELRILAKYNASHTGRANMPHLIWWKHTAMISNGRKSREEAVDMIKAEERKKRIPKFHERAQQAESNQPMGA